MDETTFEGFSVVSCGTLRPELILEFSDFMKIPLEPHPVSLDRLRDLLSRQLDEHK